MRALLVLALLLALAPPAGAAGPTVVKVLGGFFEPSTLDIAPGTEVQWVNEDAMPHTVTSTWDEGASFDVVLRGGETTTQRFDTVGTFGVHCRPHTGMEMTVNVAEAIQETNAPVPLPGIAIAIFAPVGLALLLRRK